MQSSENPAANIIKEMFVNATSFERSNRSKRRLLDVRMCSDECMIQRNSSALDCPSPKNLQRIPIKTLTAAFEPQLKMCWIRSCGCCGHGCWLIGCSHGLQRSHLSDSAPLPQAQVAEMRNAQPGGGFFACILILACAGCWNTCVCTWKRPHMSFPQAWLVGTSHVGFLRILLTLPGLFSKCLRADMRIVTFAFGTVDMFKPGHVPLSLVLALDRYFFTKCHRQRGR